MGIKALAFASVLFLVGVFSCHPILFPISITLYIIVVFSNCNRLWKGKNLFNIAVDKTYDDAIDALKNKQRFKAIINFMAMPMVTIGIAMVVISVILLWVETFKTLF